MIYVLQTVNWVIEMSTFIDKQCLLLMIIKCGHGIFILRIIHCERDELN
jgi:hypothetical protein